MKLHAALTSIFTHLQKRTTIEPRVQTQFRRLLENAPDELTFSIQTSRIALQQIPTSRIPKPPLELEDWLEDLANELYRVGTRKYSTCSYGLTEGTHVISTYLLFLIGYAEVELFPSFEHVMKSYATLIRKCEQDFEKYRPSEN